MGGEHSEGVRRRRKRKWKESETKQRATADFKRTDGAP